MRMILKYYLPDREFNWEELDHMSGKRTGHATWPQQMLLTLADMGFEVVMIEGFNGPAFIQEGGAYIKQAFGKEAADWMIEESDLPKEQRAYQQLLETPDVIIENRIPDLQEVKHYLNDGYLTCIVVNSRKLNNKQGYSGHFIVAYHMNEDQIDFHDPGLPPLEGRTSGLAEFEKAWADPNETAKNYIAIKLKEPTHA